MIYTKYYKANGQISGHKETDIAPPETDIIGIIEGYFGDEFYIIGGIATLRTQATGMAVSKTSIIANGIDTAVISGLPTDCWISVEGLLIHITNGTFNYTSNRVGYVELHIVGKYYSVNPLRIKCISLMADTRNQDPKWQAIEDATPAEISSWIDLNVTDLASARSLLKTIMFALRVLHDRTKG